MCYHVDVDGGDGDGDRCGGLHDDGVDGDGFPSANSPSGHLPEARVWWIFVVWCLLGRPLVSVVALCFPKIFGKYSA